jgi:hypothetical protein
MDMGLKRAHEQLFDQGNFARNLLKETRINNYGLATGLIGEDGV